MPTARAQRECERAHLIVSFLDLWTLIPKRLLGSLSLIFPQPAIEVDLPVVFCDYIVRGKWCKLEISFLQLLMHGITNGTIRRQPEWRLLVIRNTPGRQRM